MAGSRALVVSVLAHGAALAMIAWWFDNRAPPPPPPSEGEPMVALEVVTAAAAPIEIEVAMLDMSAPAPADDGAGVRDARAATRPAVDAPSEVARPGSARADAAARLPASAAEVDRAREPAVGSTGEPSAEPGRQSPLGMRGRRHDLTLSDEAAARSLGPERPPQQRAKPTGKIAPAGREGVIDDAVAKFRVHGDGTVDIVDKPDLEWEWRVPIPTRTRILQGAKELGDDLAAWREDPYRDTRAGKMQDLPRHIQAVPGLCERYGDGMCDAVEPETGTRRKPKVERSLSGDGLIIPIIGGKADITAYLHRKFVGDPFASRKLKLLDDTRAERVESGTAFRAKQLERSAEMMANNLASLWATTADPAARREALFELWDECVEGDGEPGAAGERARAMVTGWIRARLPRGAASAYTDEEVRRLDARRGSRQHFAPY